MLKTIIFSLSFVLSHSFMTLSFGKKPYIVDDGIPVIDTKESKHAPPSKYKKNVRETDGYIRPGNYYEEKTNHSNLAPKVKKMSKRPIEKKTISENITQTKTKLLNAVNKLKNDPSLNKKLIDSVSDNRLKNFGIISTLFFIICLLIFFLGNKRIGFMNATFKKMSVILCFLIGEVFLTINFLPKLFKKVFLVLLDLI